MLLTSENISFVMGLAQFFSRIRMTYIICNILGNGKYNITLLMALSFVLMSMAMDMFGFSVVVAGCSCDFNLTLAERGVLSSTPFIGLYEI